MRIPPSIWQRPSSMFRGDSRVPLFVWRGLRYCFEVIHVLLLLFLHFPQQRLDQVSEHLDLCVRICIRLIVYHLAWDRSNCCRTFSHLCGEGLNFRPNNTLLKVRPDLYLFTCGTPGAVSIASIVSSVSFDAALDLLLLPSNAFGVWTCTRLN